MEIEVEKEDKQNEAKVTDNNQNEEESLENETLNQEENENSQTDKATEKELKSEESKENEGIFNTINNAIVQDLGIEEPNISTDANDLEKRDLQKYNEEEHLNESEMNESDKEMQTREISNNKNQFENNMIKDISENQRQSSKVKKIDKIKNNNEEADHNNHERIGENKNVRSKNNKKSSKEETNETNSEKSETSEIKKQKKDSVKRVDAAKPKKSSKEYSNQSSSKLDDDDEYEYFYEYVEEEEEEEEGKESENDNEKARERNRDDTGVMITAVKEAKSPDNVSVTTGRSNRSRRTNQNPYEKATLHLTSGYSEDEINVKLDRYLRTKKLPPIECREDVAQVGRQRVMDLLVKEDYDKADKLKTALEILIQDIESRNMGTYEEEMNRDLKGKLDNAHWQQVEISEKYKNRFGEFEFLKAQSKEILQQRHEAEIRMFNEKWEKPETFIPFSKPSVRLVKLREMQKNQAFTLDFAEAKKIKAQADALQKEEMQMAKKRAATAMGNEYQALMEKHQREFDFWNQNWERKRFQIETEKSTEERANSNLQKQLTLRLNSPKFPKKKAVILPIPTARSVSSSLGMLSVTTRSTRTEYKNRPSTTRFDLRPTEIRSIVKPKLPKQTSMSATIS